MKYAGLIEKYHHRLSLAEDIKPISLCEGNTPLIPLRHIPGLLAEKVNIYVKYEGVNPTGSFKDRGMTVAVTQAVHEGAKAIICASTGNTSAAAAAYAARAGIDAFVLVPDGNIAMGKLAQAMMHGARILQIAGNFDEGMQLVKEISQSLPIALVNSVNPYRLQGQKTAAFEIVEALGAAPDFHALPVGNAGNISAYWMGYGEDASRFNCQTPKMLGYQAAGAAPFLAGQPIAQPETVATAIRIGHPQSWDKAENAVRQSQGWFAAFDDSVILQAQKLLAEHEGVFCEPASAISIAGVMHDVNIGKIPAGSTIVCTLTGHGLKDPDIAMGQCAAQPIKIPATLDAVKQVIDKP